MEEGRLRETRLSEAPEPEVQFAVDGRVMVMKSDDMNLQLGGREMSHARTQCSQELARWIIRPERSSEINITRHRAGVSAVSPLLYVSRETEGKLRRIALPETPCERMC